MSWTQLSMRKANLRAVWGRAKVVAVTARMTAMLARQPEIVSLLLSRLEALRPMIKDAAPAFDRDRRLPDNVFNALADAGLFRLWLPRSLDGFELAPADFMQVVETASMLDASVGWLVGNLGGYSRTGGYLPKDVARRFFSEPRSTMVCSNASVGTATPVDGGYRVSGRWSFGSGIHHATSVSVLCAISGSGQPPRTILCYLDAAEVRIHDTWRTSGLRGTGSCDFEIAGTFVATDHTHDMVNQPSSDPSLLYRIPNISMFNWTVATVPLGIAEGVLRQFTAAAATKMRTGHPVPLAEREVVQDMLGRLDAQRRSARAFMLEALADLTSEVAEKGDRLVEARAVYRSAVSNAAETAVAIVDRVMALYGAGAIFEDTPFERAHRDVHAASKHFAMSPTMFVNAGRIMLGLTPLTARF